MKTFLYKRTHEGDPAPDEGVFGRNNCEGIKRSWQFDNAIGIGGKTMKPRGLVYKVHWMGIGRILAGHYADDLRLPMWSFQHFKYFEGGYDIPADWQRYAENLLKRSPYVFSGGLADPFIQIIINITIIAPPSPGLKTSTSICHRKVLGEQNATQEKEV